MTPRGNPYLTPCRCAAGVAALAPFDAVLTAGEASAAAAPPAKPFDFNGDGYRDLATGVPAAPPSTARSASAARNVSP